MVEAKYNLLNDTAANSTNSTSYGDLIKKIYYYSSYAFGNFDEEIFSFALSVAEVANSSLAVFPTLRADAKDFVADWETLWSISNASLSSSSNPSSGDVVYLNIDGQMQAFNSSTAKQMIFDRLNDTSVLGIRLYELYQSASFAQGTYNATQFEEIAADVHRASFHSWQMIIDFGFWHLVNFLASGGGEPIMTVPVV